jgi:acyl carrier protein
MHSKEEILDQLFGLVRPYCEQPITLREQTRLIDDVGLNSMKVMELVMQVEDHFDISVPLNILPDVQTVGEFAEQVQKLLKDS